MRTWPPTALGAWYSSDSAQHTFSGSHAGTVMEMVPPGRSTRSSSSRAPTSSGMCSITSEAMTRSKVPSGNGRRVASPAAAVAMASGEASPWAAMAPKVPMTWASSGSDMSLATTRAPRRRAS